MANQSDSAGGNNTRSSQRAAITAVLTDAHRMWRRSGGCPSVHRICRARLRCRP
jgi:hypothetical protein